MNHGVARDLKEASRMAMEAGCDIDMVMNAYYLYLADLVREGTVPEKALDEAVMRVLTLKNELGLFENPYHGADEEKEKQIYLCAEHREIARRTGADRKTVTRLINAFEAAITADPDMGIDEFLATRPLWSI